MAKKLAIPWEFKYNFFMGMLKTLYRGFMYEIRKKFDADAAIEIYEKVCKREDRVKNMTKTLKEVFNIEGNDVETIDKWWNIWHELIGQETTVLERSTTINRRKVTKCPLKTQPKDISNWPIIHANIITKTLNPKAVFELPKAMCAGDPHCEYVFKIEQSTPVKGAEEIMAKKIAIPWELKYNFVKGMSTTLFKGFMYEIREKYGAATAVEIHEKVNKRDDRLKNMTNFILSVFKIEGNDIEAIAKFWEIYNECTGQERIQLELSQTISRLRIIKCPFKTDPTDISDWCVNFVDIISNTLNPKDKGKRLKGMCAGDPYCEFISILEE